MAEKPSIANIFGLDLLEFGSLIAFLIFVYLVAGNAGAFSQLLATGGSVTTSTVKALQGR